MKSILLLGIALITAAFCVDNMLPQKHSIRITLDQAVMIAHLGYDYGIVRKDKNPNLLAEDAWPKDSADIRHFFEQTFQDLTK